MEHRCSIEHGQQPHQFQQLTGCDIVKRGTLYVKHPPSFLPAAFNIQAWKKRYVVLRDTWYCSPCVVTSLDIYDSGSEPPSLCHGDGGGGTARSLIAGRHEPYSLDLRQLTAVGFHLESRRFQFAFYVERCDARPLLFATESDLEMRCWVAALRMLADKARLGVKMSPDSMRAVSTASPGRRRTLPGVDVGVPLSLDGRRRNLSEPQLHAVPSARRRFIHSPSPRGGQLHASLQRKLTAPSDVSRCHPSPTSVMSSLDEVDMESLVRTDSPAGAAAADDDDGDDDGHHPLRRLFSASRSPESVRYKSSQGQRVQRVVRRPGDGRRRTGLAGYDQPATDTAATAAAATHGRPRVYQPAAAAPSGAAARRHPGTGRG